MTDNGCALQSAGYTLTNLIGGYLAATVGSKRTLGVGVVVWSLFTMLTPAAAATRNMPTLLATRFFMGCGEGNAYPAVQAVVKGWVSFERVPVSCQGRDSAVDASHHELWAGGLPATLAFLPYCTQRFDCTCSTAEQFYHILPCQTPRCPDQVPTDSRSRALTLVYSGGQLGTILALLTAPIIIDHLGWPAVFLVGHQHACRNQ